MSEIHGYDDAVRGRTDLVKATARWHGSMKQELQDLSRKKDFQAIVRHAEMRGDELTTGGKYRIDAKARQWFQADRDMLREAPLLYLSPGILDRFDSISDVVEDVHVLPFAEPVLLWFARPLLSERYTGEFSDAVQFDVPIRCVLVRPDAERNAIHYMTITHVGALRPLDERALRDDDELAALVARGGEYVTDIVGRLTCGKHARGIGKSAMVAARALNAMSVREARMSEAETPERRDRKEAKREGVTAPGDVHVIYLPRERGKGHVPGDTEGDPRRRHRVRAHWRRQPYGPRGAGQWRWTRIEAHERGKGPLVAQDTVYTLKEGEHGRE